MALSFAAAPLRCDRVGNSSGGEGQISKENTSANSQKNCISSGLYLLSIGTGTEEIVLIAVAQNGNMLDRTYRSSQFRRF